LLFKNPGIEDESFNNLFRAYYKSLRAYAYRYVNDVFAAEDIVQDVFCQVWKKRDDLQKIDSIRSYLFTAVYNRACNFSKHKKVESVYQNQQLSVYSELESYYSQQIQGNSDSLILLELENKIAEVINELPEQCKNIFVLSRFHDLKNQEIANKLGITVKAVEKQMTKALAILRIRLKDYLLLLICHIFN
jgi:RNA polymerase sigma-70 factor, ECF subfamily